MIDLDACLEALGVSRGLAGMRKLEEIFAAFNARVPFESASKILRRGGSERSDAAQRLPAVEEFWEGFLEKGSGGTCFARVEAFEVLVRGLGFSARKILGAVEKEGDHAALVVEGERGPLLADVGFPLPEVVALEPSEGSLPLADYRLDCGAGRARFWFLSGPQAGKSVRYDLGEPAPETFGRSWEASFRGPTKFLDNVVILRQEPHRTVRFFRGEVCLDDAHTRTRIPLRDERPRKLEELFGIEAGLLRDAFAVVGDPDPEIAGARIEAYRATPRAADLFDLVSTPEGYRRFLQGLGEAEVSSAGPGRFTVVLRGAGGDSVRDEVIVDRARRRIEVRRDAGLRSTGLRFEDSRGLSRLVRSADLPDAREEFLRNDLGRGRIAGLLAMDLLALSRLSEN